MFPQIKPYLKQTEVIPQTFKFSLLTENCLLIEGSFEVPKTHLAGHATQSHREPLCSGRLREGRETDT